MVRRRHTGQTDPKAKNIDFDSSRSITPAVPFAIYGGLKVKY